MKENRKLLKEVLKDIEHDMTDEEVLNLLADSKISESPAAEKIHTRATRGGCDRQICWKLGIHLFIYGRAAFVDGRQYDSGGRCVRSVPIYPAESGFVLRRGIQAPLIMMSQNRQEEKDRRRAENDYKVNLKTEIMIEDLHDKVNAILAKQSALEKKL